ncbi:MAG: rhomboid family intramembrane serine protease [Candidatus Blackburnbacteria bacterium]|nr:rhomboid family intramembrane serine protease [Candidatus Blackburnbacteria bacterium]
MFPLRDTKSAGIFPFWIITIVAVNVFVFLLEMLAASPEEFIRQYALIPANVSFSSLATLTPFVTSQFLHGGFIHIASNMWFLWIFGDNIEERFGFLWFPVFYLFSGIIGGLLQYVIVSDADIPMIGASGAVAGVLGAYFALFPRHRIKTLVLTFGFLTVVDIPASVMLFYWFFTQLFSGTATVVSGMAGLGGVAWFAHIGGFAAGWFFGHHTKRG